MLKISKGKVTRPLRVVVAGIEGIGKSTFAAQFPDPLFIDLEKGTHSVDSNFGSTLKFSNVGDTT